MTLKIETALRVDGGKHTITEKAEPDQTIYEERFCG